MNIDIAKLFLSSYMYLYGGIIIITAKMMLARRKPRNKLV